MKHSDTGAEYIPALAADIDWSHADLAGLRTDAARLEPRAQLLSVVRTIRTHAPEYFGFAADFSDRLRRFAGGAGVSEAMIRVDQALAGDLFFPPHSNALAALGQETLLLGVDAVRAQRIAAMVLARQSDWGRNVWAFGITHGVARLLACLCANPACADEDLPPLFGWLRAIAPLEWEEARSWENDGLLGPSGHNWYLHTYFGQWMAAALFGHFRPLQRALALAPTYLEREVHLLFAADGWSKEGSAGYHWFAAEDAFAFARLAGRHGIELSHACREQLRRIADATWRMLAPDGHPPAFGDTSPPISKPAGAAQAVSSLPEPSFVMFNRRLAARFGLPQGKAAVEALITGVAPDFLADNGDDLAAAYREPAAEPPPLDTALPASGLYAMRSSWTPAGDWLAINAMPIGPKITSHKHADIFNLEICVRGRRILVDNWYGDRTANDGSYGQDPEIRDDPRKRRWRVGSSAHNVLTVDGEDIVPVQSVYLYGWHEAPFVEAFVGDRRYAWFSGVHEAYRRLANQVAAHRRSVFYVRGEYWIVLDRLTVKGAAARTVEQHFYLPPGAVVLNSGSIRSPGPGGNLLLTPVRGLTGDLAVEPNPHPISGYQNPDHVTLKAVTTGNLLMAVVLAPFADDAVPQVEAGCVPVCDGSQELDAREATGIRIAIDGRTDIFVKQNAHWNAAWQCADCRGTGRLFHSRFGELRDIE